MISQTFQNQLTFSVINLGGSILIRAQDSDQNYEMNRHVDQIINAYEIQNAITSNNLIVTSRTSESLKIKFHQFNLQLKAVHRPFRHQVQTHQLAAINALNPIENHQQRIQTLESQNLYLRTQVDRLTEKMKEIEQKMGELILRTQENSQLKSQIKELKQKIGEKENEDQQEFSEINTLSIMRRVTSKIEEMFDLNPNPANQKSQVITQELKIAYQLMAEAQKEFMKNFELSNIIQTEEEKKVIRSFFNHKIKSAKQLYCASRNAFSVKYFHQKCDFAPNTLILIKTEFGKKIGGFTPLGWQEPIKQTFCQDDDGMSFIFSLSYKEKFPVKHKKFSILRKKGLGPMFGNDLLVGDKSNEYPSCFTNCNGKGSIYSSEKAVKDHWTMKETLGGNVQGQNQCKVLEWEVWNLEFLYDEREGIESTNI